MMKGKVFWSILCAAFLGLLVCGIWKARRETAYTEQLFAMDTYMEFTAYGKNRKQAVRAAVDEVKKLDELLSTGKAHSEVSMLNAEGSFTVSDDTAAVLKKSMEMYEKTDGLFDFTIYPVMKLWGFPTKEFSVPSGEEIEQALLLVDASGVEMEDNGRVILKPGQELDFGGIAKGYASARVMEVFRSYKIRSGQVTLGGNVQVLNTKPDGSAWKVGIRDPRGESTDVIATVDVKNKAVITSGGYERYFEEDGKTYIHIIDPGTGYPAEGDLCSVSVISEDGALSDALSTSLYIMGLERAAEFWREHRDEFDMILVDREYQLYVTDGIAENFRSEESWKVIE